MTICAPGGVIFIFIFIFGKKKGGGGEQKVSEDSELKTFYLAKYLKKHSNFYHVILFHAEYY